LEVVNRLWLAGLALAIAACGGGRDGGTEVATGDVSEAVAAPSGAEGEFCGELAQQLDLLRQVGDRLAQGDLQGAQPLLDELRTNSDALVEAAPPEIRDDVETLATAIQQSGDIGGLVASPEVQAAADNLRGYARNTCGLAVDGQEGGE
jgi:hypothetical protein